MSATQGDPKETPKLNPPAAGCSYLPPPEIWEQIFHQHTQPNYFWHIGRQVSLTWRSGITAVFAKKYLENPDMLQIYYGCGRTGISGCLCDLGVEMVFDRYEGDDNVKQRCVFAENPLTTGAENTFDNWRANVEFYLGVRPRAQKKQKGWVRSTSGPFEPRLHQIRFKTRANDTELPGLELDFERREISFEWTGMFDAFCAEAVLLERREGALLPESEQWLNDGKHAIAGALAFSKATKVAREAIARGVRRERIGKWNRGRLDREFKDRLFEEKAEDGALWALKRFEMKGDFVRCAEDSEEGAVAELIREYDEYREVFSAEYTDVYGDFSEGEDLANYMR
ncbi:hypothetical protein Q7P36_009533 [Cladosporium allicinum]